MTESVKSKEKSFEVRLDWLENKRGILTSSEVRDSIRVATPKAFGGEGSEWSPEHLLLASIGSCFMTTFLALADKLGFEVTHYNSGSVGQVNAIEGKYQFTKIDLYPEIFIANEIDREAVTLAVEKTKRYCIISRSLNFPVAYHPKIQIDKHPVHRNGSQADQSRAEQNHYIY